MIKKFIHKKYSFESNAFSLASLFIFIFLSFYVDKSKVEQRKVTWKFNLLKKKKRLQSLYAQTVPVQM